MMSGTQHTAEAFLSSLQADSPSKVCPSIISTHISKVYLTADRAFKLKRAVSLGYLDFSTADKRLEICLKELDLNRRTAPSLYLAVRRITKADNGTIAFDGDGTMIDAVVEMKRFDQAMLLDNLAQSGRLSERMISDLAEIIARFHASAEVLRTGSGVASMLAIIEMNDKALKACGLDGADVSRINSSLRLFLKTHSDQLDARRRSGMTRRCHGDMTLRNICLLDGKPTLFDCLEFDDNLAIIDVLYDLAFLVMDLVHREQGALANLLFNRYFDATAECDGVELLGFFAAIRAMIRAHVSAAQAVEAERPHSAGLKEEAEAYLALARRLMTQERPRLVAIGGRSGTGKSTVSAALAPYVGSLIGARVLSSDRVRKRLHGVAALDRLPPGAYQPDASAKVYETLWGQAARLIASGCTVMVDAVFDRSADRDAIEAVAIAAGIRFDGFWLDASLDLMTKRIQDRKDDPSDATVEVLQAQIAHDPGLIRWQKIASGRKVRVVAEDIKARLDLA